VGGDAYLKVTKKVRREYEGEKGALSVYKRGRFFEESLVGKVSGLFCNPQGSGEEGFFEKRGGGSN